MATKYARLLIIGGLTVLGGFLGYNFANSAMNNPVYNTFFDQNYLESFTHCATAISALSGCVVGMVIDNLLPVDKRTLSQRLWIDEAGDKR